MKYARRIGSLDSIERRAAATGATELRIAVPAIGAVASKAGSESLFEEGNTVIYLGPDPIQSPNRASARSRSARAVASAVRGHEDATGQPQAETHWSRILCRDLGTRDDCRSDETSMLPTEPDPRHEVEASPGKRLVIRAIVLAASCIALYLAGNALFRASTLPNTSAAVAPQGAILQSSPPVSDIPVDVRLLTRHDALASTSNDRDEARECASRAGAASECIFD